MDSMIIDFIPIYRIHNNCIPNDTATVAGQSHENGLTPNIERKTSLKLEHVDFGTIFTYSANYWPGMFCFTLQNEINVPGDIWKSPWQ